jgi:NTP pyrophosphatase (non-canonical NTP hydrolase)
MIEEFDTLMNYVISWAEAKDLIKKENATKQMLKVIEEVGETAGALAKGKEDAIKDGIGDSFVTLIILAKQLGYEPNECLSKAWYEIRNRTGKTVNGVFVKDE